MIRSPRGDGTRCLYPRPVAAAHPRPVDELRPAEEFPALYRAILDRLRPPRACRATGARPREIRSDAIRAYSKHWDAHDRRRWSWSIRRVPSARSKRDRARPSAAASAPPSTSDRAARRAHDGAAPPGTLRAWPNRRRPSSPAPLEAFDALTATADAVADELQYVTDLGRRVAGRLSAVAAARGEEAATAEVTRRDRRGRRRGAIVDDPHRAIDWLSTLPQVALVGARRADRSRCASQDARPDGRAVVYAGIQADPLVARTADLLADATATPNGVLARAVMNGDVARTRPCGGRCSRRCSGRRRRRRRPGRAPVRGDPRGVARGGRSRRAGAQPVPRRDRGVTHRAARRAGAPARSAASGGSCSTACPAEIHPYDVTVEPDGRPPPRRRGTASGAPAASRPTCSTSSTTRGGTPRTRARSCSPGSSCSTPAGRARSAWSASTVRSRSTGSASCRSRALDRLAGRQAGGG